MKRWIQYPVQRRSSLAGWGIVTGTLVVLIASLAFYRHRQASVLPEPELFEESMVVSSGTLRSGGTLANALTVSGLSSQETSMIERSLTPLLKARECQPADRFEIFRNSEGRFVKLQYWPSKKKKLEYFTVDCSSTGVFTAVLMKVPTVEKIVGVFGSIQVTKDSLWKAMSAQGVPGEMINRFAELFSWRLDFLTEPRQNDQFKLIWRRRSGHDATRDENIVCAYYHSQDKGDLIAFPLAGEYFDSSGESLRGEFLRAPLSYRRISSRFTYRRFHPILRYWRPHHGIDYSAARGTPVISIAEGVVMEKGYHGGLGNELHIRHAGSYVSIYGHLMGYARGIRSGTHVAQGQLIGYVGSTGLSTGPHLHFGFENGGKLVNFLSFNPKSKRKKIPSQERAHFESIKRESLALLNQLQPGTTLQVLKTSVATVH
ncbi:MAG: M23 family metallopeptidase [Elusimicrobiota bacterium]|jgi:murein DD-endopeptidase MepM/ murein hydrolase activator NlpD